MTPSYDGRTDGDVHSCCANVPAATFLYYRHVVLTLYKHAKF